MSEQPTIFFSRAVKKSRRREEEPSNEGGNSEVLGNGESKPFSFKDAIFNSGSINLSVDDEWGAEDFELREEDVRKDVVNGAPTIEFSNRVYAFIEENMSTTLVVKLLGRRIGYNALWNKVCFLWKPTMRIQLMDIYNNYYLARFKSASAYNNALSKGSWVIFGHYLTVQP